MKVAQTIDVQRNPQVVIDNLVAQIKHMKKRKLKSQTMDGGET